jgi:hypothetical protein
MVRLHILTNRNLTLLLDEATHDFCGLFFNYVVQLQA